ncbi:MAG: hypothetical protein UEA60_00150 [Lachnospiraceae bacterium]|nr:hypothetical protein [Lachnospiraceae bacterium]
MKKETKELLKKNNENEKQILEENDEIYTNMVVYLRGANISEYNQEKVREDLIAMIVDGQERGDDIQKVIGENYKEICDEIIAEIPKKTVKENVMYALILTLDIVWIVGVISVIKTLIIMLAKNSKDMTFVFSLGDLISWGMIVFVAYLVVYYICSTTFREKERETNKVLSFIIIWFVCCIILCAIILPSLLIKVTIFSVHIGVAALIFGAIFVISRIMSLRY